MKDSLENEKLSNLEWLKSICTIEDQHWHNEKVIRLYDIPNFRFYKNNRQPYKAKINPRDIKGIEYAWAYNFSNDITWKELLNMLRRFNRIRSNKPTYQDLINHAKNDYNENRTVHKLGNIYITTTGQHRLALCKFLELGETDVDVIEYTFLEEEFRQYCIQKSFLDQLKNQSLINQKEDSSNLIIGSTYLSVWIENIYFRIENHLLEDFWKAYTRSKITWYWNMLDSLNTYFFESLFNYRSEQIKEFEDIRKYGRFFRELKRKNKPFSV